MRVAGLLVCFIGFFLFCVGVVGYNCTLHLWLWFCLVFWFGLFSSCGLSVGSGVGSHSLHGFYVRLCECSVGVCWRFCFCVDGFLLSVLVF